LQAIVICTVKNPGLYVLLESIKQYAPEVPVYVAGSGMQMYDQVKNRLPNAIWTENIAKSFGEAYNASVSHAFAHGNFDSVIMSNDDVVLTPTTLSLLQEDWQQLHSKKFKVGFLGARSDYVLQDQNIRFPIEGDSNIGVKYKSESYIKQTEVIAPIFAAISRQAWDAAKFPHVNWYSDNIMCNDLSKEGYEHFVSRSYVHHAGSQTVGMDFAKCHEEPREWIKANRPDVYEEYYG